MSENRKNTKPFQEETSSGKGPGRGVGCHRLLESDNHAAQNLPPPVLWAGRALS